MHTRLGRLRAALIALAVGIVAVVAQAVPASAANLWHCGNGVCTTITSAPRTGVYVKDRLHNLAFNWILHNGNSVKLVGWGVDRSNQCGGSSGYVWLIFWTLEDGSTHSAYIGDHYLATGNSSYWAHFPVTPGSSTKLNDRYLGEGRGECDDITLRK